MESNKNEEQGLPVIEQQFESEDLSDPGHQEDKSSHEGSCGELSSGDEPWNTQMSSYAVRVALKALIDNQITVVEYGAQVQYRLGNVELLVVLTNAGFDPLPIGLSHEMMGCWGTECLPHALDDSAWRVVHLLPLTLVGLTLEETLEVSSTFAPKLRLRTPRPTRYLLSLLRNIRKFPIGDYGRRRLQGDITNFMCFYILHCPPAHTPGEILDEMAERETDEEYERRIDEAVKDLRGLDWGDVEEKDLDMVERALRDAQYIETLTDVPDSNVVHDKTF
ncbi:hypothetical protein N7456_000955 [Penicillium angulare]|uniref:Uncharacterized protein n=1 Tax=Penicillium angulare TaxID=116970 RepID=A0A9W9GD61_9EURO|nr:hypothetical protein N7456_000955 [Penicillium angulare]